MEGPILDYKPKLSRLLLQIVKVWPGTWVRPSEVTEVVVQDPQRGACFVVIERGTRAPLTVKGSKDHFFTKAEAMVVADIIGQRINGTIDPCPIQSIVPPELPGFPVEKLPDIGGAGEQPVSTS